MFIFFVLFFAFILIAPKKLQPFSSPFLPAACRCPLDIHVGPIASTLSLTLLSLLVFPSSVGRLHFGPNTRFLPHNRCYVYTWP